MEHLTFTIAVNGNVRAAFFHQHDAESFFDLLCANALIGDDLSLRDRDKEILGFGSDGRQRKS